MLNSGLRRWKMEASMPTRVIPVNPDDPRADRLSSAVGLLRNGEIVGLPTETFYGLAADAFNPEAARRINALKGKPEGSPILLLLSDADQVERITEEVPPTFHLMAQMFWPGPLSLVLRAAPGIPREVTAGSGTVAVRVPGLALPRHLAAQLGGPITGVSANLTGQPACRTAGEVCRVFPDGVSMILDGGPATGGKPSTVLDLTGSEPRLVREGAIPGSALRPFLSSLRQVPV